MALGDTAKLVAQLTLDDKFSKPLSTADRNLSGFERHVGTMGRIGDQANRGLSNLSANIGRIGLVAGGLAVTGLVASAKAAVDFEDAFAGIQKTVNETDLAAAGLTFDDLSDSIRGMAREIPVAATELAAIGEAAGALGIRGQDIAAFTRVVAELGVTTDLTSEDAATALGQLGTTLHLSGEEFREFGDSLVALGNAGASTESQIIDIASRFAAAGNSAGLSKEEILALSSAVASMGIDAEAGGSSLSKVFNSVATNIGTSNSKAKEFAKALGVSATDFKKAWAEDALGTFELFLEKLNTLDQFEAASLLKKVGITSVRDVSTVRLMAQNVGFVNDQLAVSEHATDALGIEASKKFATTASQLQILRNNFTDVGITIGSAVLPKITEMTGKLVEFINTPGTQKVITDIAAALPAGIDQLVALGTSLPWDAIGSAFEFMGTGSKALLTAFTSMPSWIQTAVLTSWGLNKLTGGALTGILGTVGEVFIKGVLGMNAGVVNINAATVNGGLPGTGGTGGGGLSSGAINVIGTAGAAAAVGGGILAINDIAAGTEEGTRAGWVAISGGFPSLIARAITEVIGDPLGDLVDELTKPEPTALSTAAGPTFRQLEQAGEKLQNIDQRIRDETMQIQRQITTTTPFLARTSRATEGIERKPWSPTINVRTQSNLYIAGRTVQAIITQQQLKVGTGPQEF